MLKRIRIVWKLSAVFTAIIFVLLVATSYINNMIEEHFAVSTAREVSGTYFDTIRSSMHQVMMDRDLDRLRRTLSTLVENNPVCRDVRLIAHDSGRVVAPRDDDHGTFLTREYRSCSICHDLENMADRLAVERHDEIFDLPEGGRMVAVTAPVFNEDSCRNAACHAHENSPAVLGLLEAEFSLSQVDSLISSRNLQTFLAVVIAVLLSCGAAWIAVHRFFKGPVHEVINGMNQLAERQFDYRLDEEGMDEFGDLATSFNDMASMLSSSQNELMKTRDYVQGILESTADIIVTMNPTGRIQTINVGAEQALGYLRQEVVGQQLETLFAQASDGAHAFELLESRGSVVNFQTIFVTKDEETRDLLLTLSQLKNPLGQIVGTIGIGKDITEETRLQKELIQSQRLAAIGQVFTGIQHSMKNMLNAMKGGAFMVKTGLKRDDRDMLVEGWGMVQEGISRMTDMSMKMLKYVKEWKPDLQKVDLRPTLTDIQQVIEQTAKDKGVDFSLTISSDLPEVICDAQMIHTAMMDIVSNALDACLMKEYEADEKPSVAVSAYPDPDNHASVLKIEDNGCGMSEKVKANMFTPFFSTKDRTGTGLGLAITSRIISVHGGKIEVESEPDRGAIFRIVLPIDGTSRKQGDH